MKHSATLGIICLARKTFDYQEAHKLYKNVLKDLSELENIKIESINELIIEVEDAQKAASELLKKNIDALVCISGTFHLGHLALEINKTINKPLLLWALPELPYDGGKIRLNSICGLNLNASNLYKAGIRNFHVHAEAKIDQDWVDAIRINSSLSKSHVGLAGFRAHGFFNISTYDPNIYKNYGILLDHYELSDIFNHEVSKNEVSKETDKIKSTFNTKSLNPDQVEKLSSLTAKLNKFINENNLDALSIRCWPEFAGEFGISPCAAMSVVQSEDKIIACEGDVEGAISMLAHRAAGAETPFLFDFSQINFEENYALLWHCGVAPCNLWDGKCDISLDTYFAGGKGITADFVLKEGDVSMLRFDAAGDTNRVFLQNASGISMDKDLKGTYLKVTFDKPVKDVFEKVVYNGIAHHASMAYGDFIKPLEIFSRIKGWEVIK